MNNYKTTFSNIEWDTTRPLMPVCIKTIEAISSVEEGLEWLKKSEICLPKSFDMKVGRKKYHYEA